LKFEVSKRRGLSNSVPGLDIETGCAVADEMFTEFNMPEYVGAVTAEMEKRPIVHVFQTSKTAALTTLYIKWAPSIFARLIGELVPPIQTYNKVSRLGWDNFSNPPNKRDVLFAAFDEMDRDGLLKYQSSYVIIGVRLQPEEASKKREFAFVNSSGEVYSETITAKTRRVKLGSTTRMASKTRLIFNMPLPNLKKQVLDTAIHNVFLKYPAFHHDMFNKRLLPVVGKHLALDVRHFERFTADAVRHRATDVIGGTYGEIGRIFASIPFAVPTDDWSDIVFVRPRRSAGWSDQFSSGDSAVAPAQKEIFTALYAEYFHLTRGMSEQEAITTVWRGGDETLTIRNYGDDNSLSGKESELRAVYSFLAEYLDVQEEDPPKFLGFLHDPVRGWYLPASSYLEKTYLNERRPYSNFRPFPNLGWVLKRKIYSELGDPMITTRIYPYEDAALREHGLSWSTIAARAADETVAATAHPGTSSPNYILGKDYAMTAEEQLATGQFIGLQPERTAIIIKQMLGIQWHKYLKW
jgi:hypothetical protein